MSEEDVSKEQVEALIAEFEKTKVLARTKGRLDIVEKAQVGIDNLREKLAAVDASQARLDRENAVLRAAQKRLDEVTIAAAGEDGPPKGTS